MKKTDHKKSPKHAGTGGNDGSNGMHTRREMIVASLASLVAGAGGTALLSGSNPDDTGTAPIPEVPNARTQPNENALPQLDDHSSAAKPEAEAVRESAQPPQEEKTPDPIPSLQPNRYVIELSYDLLPYLRYGDPVKSNITGMITPPVYLDTSNLTDTKVEVDTKTNARKTSRNALTEKLIPLTPGGAAEVIIVAGEKSRNPADNPHFSLFKPEAPNPIDLTGIADVVNTFHREYITGYTDLLTPDQRNQYNQNQQHLQSRQYDLIKEIRLDGDQKSSVVKLNEIKQSKIDAYIYNLGAHELPSAESNYRISEKDSTTTYTLEDGSPEGIKVSYFVTGYAPKVPNRNNAPGQRQGR